MCIPCITGNGVVAATMTRYSKLQLRKTNSANANASNGVEEVYECAYTYKGDLIIVTKTRSQPVRYMLRGHKMVLLSYGEEFPDQQTALRNVLRPVRGSIIEPIANFGMDDIPDVFKNANGEVEFPETFELERGNSGKDEIIKSVVENTNANANAGSSGNAKSGRNANAGSNGAAKLGRANANVAVVAATSSANANNFNGDGTRWVTNPQPRSWFNRLGFVGGEVKRPTTATGVGAKWLPTSRTVKHKGVVRKLWVSAKNASVLDRKSVV